MAKRKKKVTDTASKKVSVTYGSGNVFADLGFEDAEELQVKAGLTHQICDRIKELGLTQVQVGKRLNISQPDISKLMKGRYTGLSADRLIALLNALEVDIDIVLRPHAENGNPYRGRVRIMAEDARRDLPLDRALARGTRRATGR